MKVKNLYIVNTRLIKELTYRDNFNFTMKSIDNGYKILEQKLKKVNYQNKMIKIYYYPETDKCLHTFNSQKEGDIYRTKPIIPLSRYCNKEEISIEEVKQLEKEINEKGLVKKKKKR